MEILPFNADKPWRDIHAVATSKRYVSADDEGRQLRNVFLSYPELASCRDRNGKTVWHFCLNERAFTGRDSIPILLNEFFNDSISVRDDKGRTPLSMSLVASKVLVAEKLVEFGSVIEDKEIEALTDVMTRVNLSSFQKLRLLHAIHNKHGKTPIAKSIRHDTLMKVGKSFCQKASWRDPDENDIRFFVLSNSLGATFPEIMLDSLKNGSCSSGWQAAVDRIDAARLLRKQPQRAKTRSSL